jgi:hypothetical protein
VFRICFLPLSFRFCSSICPVFGSFLVRICFVFTSFLLRFYFVSDSYSQSICIYFYFILFFLYLFRFYFKNELNLINTSENLNKFQTKQIHTCHWYSQYLLEAHSKVSDVTAVFNSQHQVIFIIKSSVTAN